MIRGQNLPPRSPRVGTSIGAYADLIYADRKPAKVITLSIAETDHTAWAKDTEALRDLYGHT